MIIDKKYIHLSTSLFFKLLINVFVVFYIAKKVPLSDFGSFSIAFIIGTMTTLSLDFGFNLRSLILSNKNRKEINEELSAMIFSKLIISILIIFGTFFFIYFISTYTNKTNILIVILIASAFPNSFGNFYLNNFKILGEFDKEAIGYTIQGTILIFLLIINSFYGENDIIYYAMVLFIARLFYFLFGLLIFRKYFFKMKTFNINKSLNSIKKATPYGVHLILGASIIYIDTFILSILSNLESVGLYQAGMRIIMASMLISVIINDAFIPVISNLVINKELASKKLSKLFEFILLFSTLVVTSLFFYKKTVILLLFSNDFLELESYILLVLIIVFLRYIGIVPGIILTSFGKQIIRAKAVVLSIIISIILNVILIPIYGIKGAFISSLIAHVSLNIIYLYFSYKIVNFTKNIYLLVLIMIFLLNLIIQEYVFRDSFFYLGVTIVINIFVIYFFKKRTFSI